MNNLNVIQILSYGVIGLGFLLAFLSYLLLRTEQKRSDPRKVMLRSIHLFMIFSIILTVVGLGSEGLRNIKNLEAYKLSVSLDKEKKSPFALHLESLIADDSDLGTKFKTRAGDKYATQTVISQILERQVLPKIQELVQPENPYRQHGKVSVYVDRTSRYKITWSETNFPSSVTRDISNILSGIEFPPPQYVEITSMRTVLSDYTFNIQITYLNETEQS